VQPQWFGETIGSYKLALLNYFRWGADGGKIMHIDRQMVGLFFEIRRSLPLNTRKNLRISENGVERKLIILHTHTSDKRLKNLIERFLQLSGEHWMDKIKPLKKHESFQYAKKKKICEKILNQQH